MNHFWILAVSGSLISTAFIKELRPDAASLDGRRERVGTVIAIMGDGERKTLFDSSTKQEPGEPDPTSDEAEAWAKAAFVKLRDKIKATKPGGELDIKEFVRTLPLVIEYPDEPDEPVQGADGIQDAAK